MEAILCFITVTLLGLSLYLYKSLKDIEKKVEMNNTTALTNVQKPLVESDKPSVDDVIGIERVYNILVRDQWAFICERHANLHVAQKYQGCGKQLGFMSLAVIRDYGDGEKSIPLPLLHVNKMRLLKQGFVVAEDGMSATFNEQLVVNDITKL